jgi:hypothetical protein
LEAHELSESFEKREFIGGEELGALVALQRQYELGHVAESEAGMPNSTHLPRDRFRRYLVALVVEIGRVERRGYRGEGGCHVCENENGLRIATLPLMLMMMVVMP